MAVSGSNNLKVRPVTVDSNVIKLAVCFDKPLQDRIKSIGDLDPAKKAEATVGTLIEFNKNEPLSAIIAGILASFHLRDDGYDLQFSSPSKKYVTDENRNELKNGDVLVLTTSVKRLVVGILQKLSQSGNDRIESLRKLSSYCKDLAIAKELAHNDGHKVLFSLIENGKLENHVAPIALQCVCAFMEQNVISWDSVEVPFISKVVNFVNSSSSDSLLLQHSLSILESVLGSSKASYVEKGLTFPNLASKIQTKSNDFKVHLNTISLINALLLRAEDRQRKSIIPTLYTRNIRNLIVVNIVRDGNTIGAEMLHQLHVLQTLCLNVFADQKDVHLNPQDHDSLEKIKELRTIAFEVDDSNTNTIRKPSFAREYRKLGFQNDINPAIELHEPPGLLALDCMHYFARNYTDRYRKFIFENSKGGDRDCPFGSASIELTKLLCDVLQIGEPPREQGGTFYPMFLGSDSPFNELFSICIQIVNKTWKEMHATAADITKVFQIVREQVVRTLKQDVQSFDAFRQKMQLLSYNEINNLLQQERQLKEESGSNSKQIVELRQMLTPELMELIQQQRLGYLVRGSRFAKYSRGQRLKDKFWFIRLTPSHKVFHYGDCDDKTVPSVDDLKHKVPLVEVKDILVGRDCPHMKDIKAKKLTHLFAFSLVLDTPEPSTLDFMAPDEKTYDYWVDGINALLGRPLTSKEAKNDLHMLLAVEVKLQTLELEGMEIPEEPPTLPPEPENYDFYFQ